MNKSLITESFLDDFVLAPMREDCISAYLRLADEGMLAPWSEADYRAEIEMTDSITIHVENVKTLEIIAFLILRLITSGDPNFYSQAELLNITTQQNHRKKGIAATILQKAITLASAHTPAIVWLEVRAGNSAAIQFYGKHGFERDYVRKDYYSAPVEDAIVMKREI